MAKKERNPFKQLEASLREAPPGMKKKVMNDIAAAKLIMDMASLFSINVGSALRKLFRTLGEH
ncbi:hypothetical protein F8C76_16815 [Flagellimonas olearia]|jgi:hypothetical protein|uniref:Uncharacterized protein n=1 Tax=Flagellimonas olearia TaxID=552546 RepID=A0A6I1E1G2_9FLAO|nr:MULTISPECIES: hypothetical protein [Allomuricauda]KAB7529482.1 hypothetical protein F8C76_16815 [Allomuricauda olearia]MCR9264869.1 hypothetical protein [Flavobacteriaceae bacterium]